MSDEYGDTFEGNIHGTCAAPDLSEGCTSLLATPQVSNTKHKKDPPVLLRSEPAHCTTLVWDSMNNNKVCACRLSGDETNGVISLVSWLAHSSFF